MNRIAFLAAALAFSFSPMSAIAEVCELENPSDDFGDTQPPYNGSSSGDKSRADLLWVADADPLPGPDNVTTAWHLIVNQHNSRLSFGWPKIGWNRYFDDPLDSQQADCIQDYGVFRLDTNAPIFPANAPRQGAVAYVRTSSSVDHSDTRPADGDSGETSTTGGSARTGSISGGRFVPELSVSMTASFLTDDEVVRAAFDTTGGALLGWRPEALGINLETAQDILKSNKFKFEVYGPQDVFTKSGMTGAKLDDSGLSIITMEAEKLDLDFKEVGIGAQQTSQLLLISPENTLVGVKTIIVPWAEIK